MAATTKPLTSEAIALTEKKMDMTLDEIIKMSKKPTQRLKNHRIPNKNQKFGGGGAQGNDGVRGNPLKVRQFMNFRSSVRQGALAQRRSNFQANSHFPLATEVAKKAGAAPARSRPFNRSRQGNWNKQSKIHRISRFAGIFKWNFNIMHTRVSIAHISSNTSGLSYVLLLM
ncbi:hypothetical protein MKX01_004288 [Papaver californicum]|nr:hypothetical protein MKX01_004288 [Papaver californicum]